MPSGNLTDLVLASVVRPLVTDNDFDSFCMIVKDFSMHGTLTTQSDEKHRHSSRTNDFFFNQAKYNRHSSRTNGFSSSKIQFLTDTPFCLNRREPFVLKIKTHRKSSLQNSFYKIHDLKSRQTFFSRMLISYHTDYTYVIFSICSPVLLTSC